MARMCGRDGEPAVRKGPWTLEEDLILVSYISYHGEGSWDSLARAAGLNRNGKSCRLRWLNYLRPGVRRGSITLEEDAVIWELHASVGNRWSKIAKHLPGRTDNDIKNYWRTRIQRKHTGTHRQQSCLAPTTAMAASEGTSSSWCSPAASHDRGSFAAREWYLHPNPDKEVRYYDPKAVVPAAAMAVSEGASGPLTASQASSAGGDCWYMQPNPNQESYCSQNAVAATTMALDSDSSSLTSRDNFASAGDGYLHKTSYPCYSEPSSAAGHVKVFGADAQTTAQLLSSDTAESFWNVVDNLPVLDTRI